MLSNFLSTLTEFIYIQHELPVESIL